MDLYYRINDLGRLKTMDENERDHIIKVLDRCSWKIYGEGGAAEMLNINGSTLSSRMKKLGIERKPLHPETKHYCSS